MNNRNYSKCINCKKELTHYRKNSRCKKCAVKFYKGENHPNWHLDHYCKCGKKLWKYYESKGCHSCTKKGNKNGRWIDGRSYENYPKDFTLKLREKIRIRDGNKCVICGMTKKDHFKKYHRNLEIHHKDHNKQNCKEDNLETRCKKCNLNDNFK